MNSTTSDPNDAVYLVWDIERYGNSNSTLLRGLKDCKFADFCLVSEDIGLRCHKFMLAIYSAFFDGVLKDNPGATYIRLYDFTVDVVALVLEYIYSGRIAVKGSKLISFYHAARMLKLHGHNDIVLIGKGMDLFVMEKELMKQSLFFREKIQVMDNDHLFFPIIVDFMHVNSLVACLSLVRTWEPIEVIVHDQHDFLLGFAMLEVENSGLQLKYLTQGQESADLPPASSGSIIVHKYVGFRLKNEKKRYFCECGKDYASLSGVVRHVTESKNTSSLVCENCRKSFATTRGLQKHRPICDRAAQLKSNNP